MLAAREMVRKVSHVGTVDDARIFLEKIRQVRANKGEEAAYYYEEGIWIDDDGTIQGPEVAMPDKRWTWAYLRKKYREHKLPTLNERWASQYEVPLRNPCFNSIENKPVGLLNYEDIEKARDNLNNSKSKSQASRTISIARSMLDWAYAEHALRTGLAKLQFFWGAMEDRAQERGSGPRSVDIRTCENARSRRASPLPVSTVSQRRRGRCIYGRCALGARPDRSTGWSVASHADRASPRISKDTSRMAGSDLEARRG